MSTLDANLKNFLSLPSIRVSRIFPRRYDGCLCIASVVLHNLRDRSNTIVVIEHNLDVIKACDWIIDLGPNGGDGGGQIVATGTPESIASNADSVTGQYLKPHLKPASGIKKKRSSTTKKVAAKKKAVSKKKTVSKGK